MARDKRTRGQHPRNISAQRFLGFAVVAFAIAGSGCHQPVYSVETEGPFPTEFNQYRVVRNGQPIATFNPETGARFPVAGGRFERAATTMNSLSVERLTPCGWRAAQAKTDRRVDGEPNYYLNVTEPEEGWKSLQVFVDNRHGGAAHIAIGGLDQVVDAGQYTTLELPVSSVCPEADQLKLNSDVIASVNAIESQRKFTNSLAKIFVDTTADHCYTYQWAFYGEAIPGVPVEGSEQLAAMRVRLMEDSVDYYFMDLPNTMMADSRVGQGSKAVLKDRACGR